MTDTPNLQENIESNDRLAEGLVRGVQEMGASQAKIPVHIDGETWDVTVRFRGARLESDELQFKLEHSQAQTRSANALIDKIQKIVGDFFGENERWSEFDVLDQGVRKIAEQARAVSSPAPSPTNSDASKSHSANDLTSSDVKEMGNSATPHVTQRLQRLGLSYLKYLMKHGLVMIEVDNPIIFHGLEEPHSCLCHPFVGVTGSEGKDEVESRGKDIVMGSGAHSGDRVGSDGTPLPDPLASPAVVSGLRYIAESPAQEHGGFHPQAIKTAKDAIALIEELASKVAELQRSKDAEFALKNCFAEALKQAQATLKEIAIAAGYDENILNAPCNALAHNIKATAENGSRFFRELGDLRAKVSGLEAQLQHAVLCMNPSCQICNAELERMRAGGKQ